MKASEFIKENNEYYILDHENKLKIYLPEKRFKTLYKKLNRLNCNDDLNKKLK